MTTRCLPRDEWHKLAGWEADVLVPHLSDLARVVVVEDEGQIVGLQVLQPILHAEGLEIRPDHRKKSAVARHLRAAVKAAVAAEYRVQWFATACASDEVQRLLERFGAVALPPHYMVPIGGM